MHLCISVAIFQMPIYIRVRNQIHRCLEVWAIFTEHLYGMSVGRNGPSGRSSRVENMSGHSGSDTRQNRPRKQKNRDKDFLQRNIEVRLCHQLNDSYSHWYRLPLMQCLIDIRDAPKSGLGRTSAEYSAEGLGSVRFGHTSTFGRTSVLFGLGFAPRSAHFIACIQSLYSKN